MRCGLYVIAKVKIVSILLNLLIIMRLAFLTHDLNRTQIFNVADCDQQEQRKDKCIPFTIWHEGGNDAIQPLYDEKGHSNGLVSTPYSSISESKSDKVNTYECFK